MIFLVGQVVWTNSLYYTDGIPSLKMRPYLIVKADARHIYTLDVSTTAGKSREWTAGIRVKIIKKFNPPLISKSFVKLDSLTCIPVSIARNWRMFSRTPLDSGEVEDILRTMDDNQFWQIRQ